MNFNLEKLSHQREALDAILETFPERDYHAAIDEHGVPSNDSQANPMLVDRYKEEKFIDVKMETGTGKTYVYTRMMYELLIERGISKFVVVVPSLAIKSGARSFMTSDYANLHFKSEFGNEKQLKLYEVKSGDFAKKKGRYGVSNDLIQFTIAMTTVKNTIHVLLINEAFLQTTSSLFKSHYDQSFFHSAKSPSEAILLTRPVVIIDEPHRFKRDGKAYQNLINQFDPQMIVRFGATFPEAGTGRNKRIDYYSKPVYDLTAVDAFNDGLVKGIDVIYPDLATTESSEYKVKNVTSKLLTLSKDEESFVYTVGENIPFLEGDVKVEKS